MTITRTRKPYPQSEQAEKGVISSIMLAPDKLEVCAEQITPEFFFHPCRSTIFKSLLEMKDLGKPCDFITLTQYLEDKNILESVGGAGEISELFSFCPTASNLSYYLSILKEKHAIRLAMKACDKVRDEVAQSQSLQEIFNLTTGAFTEAQELCADHHIGDYHKESMAAFLDKMESIAMGTNKPDLFPTGLPTIDEESGGMTRGELIMIRGQSGGGKSLLGQSFMHLNCVEHKRKGAIITLEMPHDQFMRRLIAADGRVSLKSMRDGKYDKGELDRFSKSFTRIEQSPLRIYDVFHLKTPTPSRIFAKIRETKRQHGLDIVMIDHLHRVKHKAGGNDRGDELLNDFSRDFKNLCLELRIVGVLLAQENQTGGTFGSTQVDTDVDGSISLVPVKKKIGGIERVVGTNSAFITKWREGNLLGRLIPLEMEGKFATLKESKGEF